MGAFARHVVAVQRRQRHEFDIQIARQLLGKGQVILFELLEHRFTVVHQIHFVHRHHQMANAQQGCDKTVATSLVQHPLRASINRIARSQVEAPVAMLRVYCSCPEYRR